MTNTRCERELKSFFALSASSSHTIYFRQKWNRKIACDDFLKRHEAFLRWGYEQGVGTFFVFLKLF
jgi:hypothetical protein